MSKEIRAGKLTEFRSEPEEDGRYYFTARVCNYGVADSYKTAWKPGVFRASLERELPTAVFAHQWDRPIGRVVSYNDGPEGLDVRIRMSDLEANPDAKRMWSHLVDGEIRQFSFAFERVSEERADDQGVTLITEATLDEVSPVLKGSVPGTKVLALRSNETMNRQTAADLLVKFAAGELDLAEALTTLKTTGGTGEGMPGGEDGKPQPDQPPLPNQPAPEPDEDSKKAGNSDNFGDDEITARLNDLASGW